MARFSAMFLPERSGFGSNELLGPLLLICSLGDFLAQQSGGRRALILRRVRDAIEIRSESRRVDVPQYEGSELGILSDELLGLTE